MPVLTPFKAVRKMEQSLEHLTVAGSYAANLVVTLHHVQLNHHTDFIVMIAAINIQPLKRIGPHYPLSI